MRAHRRNFGLPGIVKNRDDLARILCIVDTPANGLTLCSGSQNDVEAPVQTQAAR